MAGSSLLEKRLIIVTGKGGVGKSTIAAALAILAARRRKRVLICEINAQERIAPLLGARPSGDRVREVLSGISTVNVTPQAAMREYGLMVLKFQTIYEAVFENRVVRFFLRAVPSLAELVMLGKVLHEARAEDRPLRPRWDLVIMDAPATGHALQLLRVPSALIDTVPPGPLRRDAEWMRDLLVDPRRTALSMVTLPEEMPVNETIELDEQVRSALGISRGPLFINAMPEDRFTPNEQESLAALAQRPHPLGPAAQAAQRQAGHRAEASRFADMATAALDLPNIVLPLLGRARWDRQAIEQVADAMSRAGVEG